MSDEEVTNGGENADDEQQQGDGGEGAAENGETEGAEGDSGSKEEADGASEGADEAADEGATGLVDGETYPDGVNPYTGEPDPMPRDENAQPGPVPGAPDPQLKEAVREVLREEGLVASA